MDALFLPPANEVAGRLCFYRCLWFCPQGGGACVVAPGGHVWLLPGGMRGCSRGGHAWLLPGGMRGCSQGGHAWLLPGGACVVAPWGSMHSCSWRGMCGCCWGGHAWLLRGVHGCCWGACMVAPGGCVWDMTRYGDTINERAVRILLECILVKQAGVVDLIDSFIYYCGLRASWRSMTQTYRVSGNVFPLYAWVAVEKKWKLLIATTALT